MYGCIYKRLRLTLYMKYMNVCREKVLLALHDEEGPPRQFHHHGFRTCLTIDCERSFLGLQFICTPSLNKID
jgi:hypothetical protein